MDSLSPELVLTVLRFAGSEYNFVMKRVCRQWRDLLEDLEKMLPERLRFLKIKCAHCLEHPSRPCNPKTWQDGGLTSIMLDAHHRGHLCSKLHDRFGKTPCWVCLIARSKGSLEFLAWAGASATKYAKLTVLDPSSASIYGGVEDPQLLPVYLMRQWDCAYWCLRDALRRNQAQLWELALAAGARPDLPVAVVCTLAAQMKSLPETTVMLQKISKSADKGLRLLLAVGAAIGSNVLLAVSVYESSGRCQFLARVYVGLCKLMLARPDCEREREFQAWKNLAKLAEGWLAEPPERRSAGPVILSDYDLAARLLAQLARDDKQSYPRAGSSLAYMLLARSVPRAESSFVYELLHDCAQSS